MWSRDSHRPSAAATGGGFAAIVLWSSTIALARSLAEGLGPLTAAAAVYLCAGALCQADRLRKRRVSAAPRGLSRRYVLGGGLLFVLYTTLLYLAVGLARDREEVLVVGLLNYLWPAATILLSVPLLKKRAGPLLLPGTVLALAGVFLVMTQGEAVSSAAFVGHLRGNLAACLAAFAAALVWALYSVLTRRWAGPRSQGAVAWFIPVTGLVLLALSLSVHEPRSWTARAWSEVAFLGLFTAVAYALWETAMQEGNLLLVAAGSYFTPLLSTVVSCVYLCVTPGPRLWLGGALLVIGSLLSWRGVSDRERAAERV